MTEKVILVDREDRELGVMPKLEAHEKGLLHRAFSVFIFNTEGELLLQKRAITKYHSAGLWSNTCCSHPRPGETTQAAAERRLLEEMGISCPIREVFSFTYHAPLENGLIEHEFDHVFMGISNTIPKPNPEEVSAWTFLSRDVVMAELQASPENYTAWFRICLEQWQDELFKNNHS